MKLRHYLNELFTSKVPIKVMWSGKDALNMSFMADEEKYHVYFSRELIHSGWFPEDFDTSKMEVEKYKGGFNAIAWNVNFQEMGFGSKFPSPFLVFSGVITAFKKFIKEKKPDIITFDASSPKLKKLYDKFVPHIEKMGFKRIRGDVVGRLSGLSQYVFLKKGII